MGTKQSISKQKLDFTCAFQEISLTDCLSSLGWPELSIYIENADHFFTMWKIKIFISHVYLYRRKPFCENNGN